MRINRWDVLAVAGAAALSAAVFAGAGRQEAEAVGPKPAAQAPAKPFAEISGCKVTAEPGAEGTAVVRAENPGASEANLQFQLVVEKREMNPTAAMSRVLMIEDFKLVKVAEQTVALTVGPGKTGETTLAFKLAPGAYTVSAMREGKKVALCSLLVAGPSKKVA